MKLLISIAWGLANNPATTHRWRRAMIIVTSALFMIFLLCTMSLLQLIRRQELRSDARVGLVARQEADTDIFLSSSLDRWESQQFLNIWIEPTSANESVLPPGVASMPQPGQSYVSPALDQLARRYPQLAARYPDRLLIHPSALRTGDELLAYTRPGRGQTLDVESRFIRRIREFGLPTPGDHTVGLSLADPVPWPLMIGAALIFLMVPAVVVLVTGLSATSEVRDHRFTVLHWLGVPRRAIVVLAILEALLLAIPSFTVTAILWRLWSSRLTHVPLVGQTLVEGDLVLSWWSLFLGIIIASIVTIVLSVGLSVLWQRNGLLGPRPVIGSTILSPWRVWPLLLALGILVIAQGRFHWAALLHVIGIVLAVVGVAVLAPVVLQHMGNKMGRASNIVFSIAGRTIEWSPIRIARPFIAIASLLVLTFGTLSYIDYIRAGVPDVEAASQSSYAFSLWWLDPKSSDIANLEDAMPELYLIPYKSQDASLILNTSCPELERYVPQLPCDPDDPYALSQEARSLLVKQYPLFLGPELILTGEQTDNVQSVFIVGSGQYHDSLDSRVRNAAVQYLLVPQVTGPGDMVFRESPLLPWIVAALPLMLVPLLVASLLAMVDRLLVNRSHRRHLLWLGMAPIQLKFLEGSLLAIPYAAMMVTSVAVGIFVAWTTVRREAAIMDMGMLASVTGLAVLIGLLGTAAVALFSTPDSDNPLGMRD